jgi:hypothetical protein
MFSLHAGRPAHRLPPDLPERIDLESAGVEVQGGFDEEQLGSGR